MVLFGNEYNTLLPYDMNGGYYKFNIPSNVSLNNIFITFSMRTLPLNTFDVLCEKIFLIYKNACIDTLFSPILPRLQVDSHGVYSVHLRFNNIFEVVTLDSDMYIEFQNMNSRIHNLCIQYKH